MLLSYSYATCEVTFSTGGSLKRPIETNTKHHSVPAPVHLQLCGSECSGLLGFSDIGHLPNSVIVGIAMKYADSVQSHLYANCSHCCLNSRLV